MTSPTSTPWSTDPLLAPDGDAEADKIRPPVPTLRLAVTDAITQAVLLELAEVGYGKLTMDAVARRAGSSKPTLYRRWPSKAEMVLHAMAAISRPVVPPDDGADLPAQLLVLIRSIHDWLIDPLVLRILPDLLAEGLRNPTVDRALTHHIGEPRRETVKAMMKTAIDRGQIRADADLEFALDLLAAPIYWRLCVLRQEVDGTYLAQVADMVYRELTLR